MIDAAKLLAGPGGDEAEPRPTVVAPAAPADLPPGPPMPQKLPLAKARRLKRMHT